MTHVVLLENLLTACRIRDVQSTLHKSLLSQPQFMKMDIMFIKRKDNGKNIKKDSIDLDSRDVVPHNRFLLSKYDAHINMEWCNQSRSIKYYLSMLIKDMIMSPLFFLT